MKRSVFIIFFQVFFLLSAFALGTQEKIDSLPNNKSLTKHRIVSLVPAITETLFALGAEEKLVARTDFCTWPSETQAIPSVGGFDGKSLSLEKIISFQPDLVCVASIMHDHLIEPLKQYGIDVFISSADSVDSVKEEILQLAAITGYEQAGKDCVEKINIHLEQAEQLAKEKPVKTVYWEVSSAPYFTCGADSFITEALELAGGKNIFGNINQPYPQVNEESIIALAPEVILFPDYTLTGDVSFFYKRKNWQQIPAIKNNKVFPVEADMFSRPGPRIGQMVYDLAKLLHQL